MASFFHFVSLVHFCRSRGRGFRVNRLNSSPWNGRFRDCVYNFAKAFSPLCKFIGGSSFENFSSVFSWFYIGLHGDGDGDLVGPHDDVGVPGDVGEQ